MCFAPTGCQEGIQFPLLGYHGHRTAPAQTATPFWAKPGAAKNRCLFVWQTRLRYGCPTMPRTTR